MSSVELFIEDLRGEVSIFRLIFLMKTIDRYSLNYSNNYWYLTLTIPINSSHSDEPIINPFVFTRYIVIGAYVGFATVGIFAYWYMYYQSADNHTLVPFEQLSNWSECTKDWNLKVNDFGPYNFQKDPCSYFTIGKTKASTFSLTVLVMIEMFNAVNALSEDSSLLTVGLFANPLLLLAIALSVALHCVILYIPFFARIFGTYPLDTNDWLLVIAFSFPVIFVDEILKIFSRRRVRAEQAAMKKEWVCVFVCTHSTYIAVEKRGSHAQANKYI